MALYWDTSLDSLTKYPLDSTNGTNYRYSLLYITPELYEYPEIESSVNITSSIQFASAYTYTWQCENAYVDCILDGSGGATKTFKIIASKSIESDNKYEVNIIYKYDIAMGIFIIDTANVIYSSLAVDEETGEYIIDEETGEYVRDNRTISKMDENNYLYLPFRFNIVPNTEYMNTWAESVILVPVQARLLTAGVWDGRNFGTYTDINNYS